MFTIGMIAFCLIIVALTIRVDAKKEMNRPSMSDPLTDQSEEQYDIIKSKFKNWEKEWNQEEIWLPID